MNHSRKCALCVCVCGCVCVCVCVCALAVACGVVFLVRVFTYLSFFSDATPNQPLSISQTHHYHLTERHTLLVLGFACALTGAALLLVFIRWNNQRCERKPNTPAFSAASFMPSASAPFLSTAAANGNSHKKKPNKID